jgi:hypothetical protein
VQRRRLRSKRKRPGLFACVRNVRDSVRRILSVSSCSNRGRKKLHDEPRNVGSSRPRRRPRLLRLRRTAAYGGAPARRPPLPLRRSALPRGPRAPRLRRARQECLVAVEVRPAGLLPAGVLALNRPRTRGVRLVAPLLPRVRLKSQTRLRKVSGGPRDCGVSNEILILVIHSPFMWSFSRAVCMHLLFFLTALVIAHVCRSAFMSSFIY